MAATVRVASVAATTFTARSNGQGTSSGSISAATHVRVADVTAHTTAADPYVRVASVNVFGLQGFYRWDGTQWVLQASNPAVNRGHGTSSGSGTVSFTVTGDSNGRGTSESRSVPAYAGELDLAGTGSLLLSGGESQPEDSAGSMLESGTGTLKLTGAALQGPAGAGSVTVVAQPDNNPPRVLLQLTGFLGATCQVYRNDPSGRRPVRTGNPATLNAGAWTGYDYEAPFGQTVTYTVVATRTVTSDPVQLAITRPWLLHPGIPGLSQPLRIVTLGDPTSTTVSGMFTVFGRQDLVVVTDGVRKSPSFQLVVKTTTAQARQAMTDLLGDASVLLLRIAYPYTGESDYQWVSIGDVTPARFNPNNYGDPVRIWTLNCQVVDAPSGLLQAQRTWGDVLAAWDSWAEVENAYATWRDVITDNPIDL